MLKVKDSMAKTYNVKSLSSFQLSSSIETFEKAQNKQKEDQCN